jgi:hypothetical protein
MLFGNSVLYISSKRKYSYHTLAKYNKKTQNMHVFFIHAFNLSIACMLDKNVYETGIKVSDESMDAIDIEYIGPHHGWSYIIKGFKV